MRTRDKLFKHYGFSDQDKEELKLFCRSSNAENKKIVRFACFRSNPEIEEMLYISLTSGKGYDALSAKKYIPIGKKDFYGYQRKALSFVYDYLRLRKKKGNETTT